MALATSPVNSRGVITFAFASVAWPIWRRTSGSVTERVAVTSSRQCHSLICPAFSAVRNSGNVA